LRLDNEGIEKLVNQHDNDAKAIREELLKMCWYMRGGMSYSEAQNLTTEERSIIVKIIEENLETTKNTQLPFF
jgi:hypothetical protein